MGLHLAVNKNDKQAWGTTTWWTCVCESGMVDGHLMCTACVLERLKEAAQLRGLLAGDGESDRPLLVDQVGERLEDKDISKLVERIEARLCLTTHDGGRKLRGKHAFRVTGAVALAELGVSELPARLEGGGRSRY